MPRNRRFALGTKGAPRLADRNVARQTINADVQKRADRRAGYESNHCEKCDVKENIHAIRLQLSLCGAPSTTQSRCSFRKATSLARPLRSASAHPEWAQ